MVDTDIKGFTFKSKLNPDGDLYHSSMDSVDTDLKTKLSRDKSIDKLNKAAKDVEDTAKNIKDSQNETELEGK